jgi:tRNA nucleotidyltransferase (CCA-adding enzyme)
MGDSRVYRLLAPLSSEALTVTWARGDAVARERIERFLGALVQVRPEVSGADLIALGAAPGEAFSAILARALDDRLDGRAVGRAEELANLRRLAASAGLIPSEKER